MKAKEGEIRNAKCSSKGSHCYEMRKRENCMCFLSCHATLSLSRGEGSHVVYTHTHT